MKRFYGLAAEDIDLDLARKRMLWISEYASVINLTRPSLQQVGVQPARKSAGRPGQRRVCHPLLVSRPSSRALMALSSRLSAGMRGVEKVPSGFELTGRRRRVRSAHCPYRADCHRRKALWDGVAARYSRPSPISLHSSFSGERGFTQSIIHNFSHTGVHGRSTVYSISTAA